VTCDGPASQWLHVGGKPACAGAPRGTNQGVHVTHMSSSMLRMDRWSSPASACGTATCGGDDVACRGDFARGCIPTHFDLA
jgi:hypothetical protein